MKYLIRYLTDKDQVVYYWKEKQGTLFWYYL